MSKLLIDGDGILYRAGFAVEKTKYLVTDEHNVLEFDDGKEAKAQTQNFGGLLWSRKEVEPEDKALMLASVIVRDIQDRYPGHAPEIWLTPSVGNFRERIATRAKYKGNRDDKQRPTHYKAIREALLARGAKVAEGEEADDALGIEMTANPGSVLVSFDKDLLQVPGAHYNWVTKEEQTISERQGALNFWKQVLSGDATDNVPGLPGVGPVKAGKLLANVKNNKEAWAAVADAYFSEFGNDGVVYAIETAQLVWVRRKPNQLWEPPC